MVRSDPITENSFKRPQQHALFPGLAATDWLPDETLFSLCSRYHMISGALKAPATSKRIFGDARLGRKHDFPSGIDAFVKRMDGALGDAMTIIYTRTIAPYFLPFEIRNKQEAFISYLRGNKRWSPASRVGKLDGRYRIHYPLKACSSCMDVDRSLHRVAYWHVSHQIPSVWLCLKHDEYLKVHGALDGYDNEWVLPRESSLTDALPLDGDVNMAKTKSSIRKLAIFSLELMKLPYGFSFDLSKLLTACEMRMKHVSNINDRAQIRIALLMDPYATLCQKLKVSPCLQDILSMTINPFKKSVIKIDMARGTTHPLRWVILLDVLFENWQEFMRAYIQAVQKQCSVGAESSSYESSQA